MPLIAHGRSPICREEARATETMTSRFIRLHDVGKRYKTKNGPIGRLRDINLDIRESEFVAIVGPSGCGKTTILKMVAGLAPYSSGTITVAATRRQAADRCRHRLPGIHHARLA